MASPAFMRFLPRCGAAAAFGTLLGLAGCQSWLDDRYADSLPPTSGVQPIKGLAQNVSIRRNALGMPLIETGTFHDALFALGYVHASDRLSQMVSLRLLAQGRLAEMAGPGALEIDRFMRTVNLRQAAEIQYRNASPRLQRFFEVYARGVNAYLYRYRDKLPMDLAQSGYRPEYWKPEDSALVFALLNFGLAVNLQEEIASLTLAQKVGSDKLAWLTPTYPDENLPFDEAEKLKGLRLDGQVPGLAGVEGAARQVAALSMLGVAASNNWAIAPQRSRSGKSLMANDTHLPLSMPSVWNYVQIRSPKYQAAGVSIAGLPGVVAGFNGKLAWGMTMVLGDNQDLYLEQLRRQGNRLYYLADGKWQPTRERQETFFIKGQRTDPRGHPRNPPWPAAQQRPGRTQEHPPAAAAEERLRTGLPEHPAGSRQDPGRLLRPVAGQDHRAGLRRHPRDSRDAAEHRVRRRKAHRLAGHRTLSEPQGGSRPAALPWLGRYRYDWDGYADPILHPSDQDPQQGWLGTANHRTVQPGYGAQLSNSWYYPERAERIAQLAGASKSHDTQSMIRMQYDQTSLFVAKLQAMFDNPGMAAPLRQAIDALPEAQRSRAREAYDRLMAFDGKLTASSSDAALYGAFLHESARQIFLDELEPEDGPAWKAFVETANLSYSAQADHLLGRDDSPFWDDTRTPQKEDKPAILARSLAAAVEFCEQRLGSERKAWQWGKLHTYEWRSDSSKMAPYLGAGERAGLGAIKGYLDRGPYPAGGDHTTLDVSAYGWGQDFDTWLIPAMRLIVDFGQSEPMIGVNSSGQSGNPASPHYADGIDAWLKGRYVSFPFQPQNLDRVYGNKRLTLTPAR